MRKRIKPLLSLTALLLAGLLAAVADAGERAWTVDYYGFRLGVQCRVDDDGAPAPRDFVALAAQDGREAGPCLAVLDELADRRGMKGYARVLWYERFVAALPATDAESAPEPVSFADAASKLRPLTRRDRLALLYAMIAHDGLSVGVVRTAAGYALVLGSDAKLSGHFWGREDHYAWEPGRPFADPGPAAEGALADPVAFHEGRPLTFPFPDLPWRLTPAGEAKTYRAPEGCPRAWDRQVRRLPELEQYLNLWPRDREVQARIADPILTAFGFKPTLASGRSGLTEQELGDCLLRYTIANMGYDWEHVRDSADGPPRNPAETLFRGGDCDELCFALIGLLRLAGFPEERLVMLRWDPGSVDSHLNLGVAPASGRLPAGTYVDFDRRRYYVMDPAYTYTYNGKLATAWGMLPDKFKVERPEIIRLSSPPP